MDRARPDCPAPVALVVEDDAAVRDLATAVLEETDLGVIACESAEAALSGVGVGLGASPLHWSAMARTCEIRRHASHLPAPPQANPGSMIAPVA